MGNINVSFEESQIRGLIDDRIDDGMPKAVILEILMDKYHLSFKEATNQYNCVIQSYLQEA